MARSKIIAATGSDPGDSTTDNYFIKALTLTFFLPMAYNRRGAEMPLDVKEKLDLLPTEVNSGESPIPGYDDTELNTTGGSAWTADSSQADGRKVSVYGSRKLSKVF